jgi:phage gpG-like protein
MSDGVSIKLELSGMPALVGLLEAMATRIEHPHDVLDAIAAHGEESTRLRFYDQVGPDGTPWKPSIRAQKTGSKTLIKSGDLESSITHEASDTEAIWGVSRVNNTDKYAVVHQFGATIEAKNGKALKFNIPGVGWRQAASVTIVPRPYLGINDDDQTEIYNILSDYLMGDAA